MINGINARNFGHSPSLQQQQHTQLIKTDTCIKKYYFTSKEKKIACCAEKKAEKKKEPSEMCPKQNLHKFCQWELPKKGARVVEEREVRRIE